MRIEARITLYRIERCGYYQWGHDVPEFGDVSTILSELRTWSRTKELGNTRTFDPSDGGNLEPTYCFDVRQASKTNNFLLTTWNEVPSGEGGVAIVDRRATVGQAEVGTAPVPGNSIPGYPAYFWFLPSLNALATVNTKGQKNGNQNLLRYIEEFMSKFTRFVASPEGGKPDLQIEGYRLKPSDPPANLRPYFRTGMIRQKSEVDLIRTERSRIVALIRKNRLNPAKAQDRKLLDRLMTKIGIYGDPPQIEPIKIRYEVSYTPSEAELEEIISEWEQRADTEWEDVGFRLRGSTSIIWLNSSIAREVATLDVKLLKSGVIEPVSLLSALESGSREILDLFGLT